MNSKSFWDYFKEMEPHFDIRYVSGVGIVSGEYFQVLAKTGCPKCGRQPMSGYELIACACNGEDGLSRWQPINPYNETKQ